MDRSSILRTRSSFPRVAWWQGYGTFTPGLRGFDSRRVDQQRMFRRKPVPDPIGGGHRFVDKNMRRSCCGGFVQRQDGAF
jgi:hypothetical protein